jgi:hypothetical protein
MKKFTWLVLCFWFLLVYHIDSILPSGNLINVMGSYVDKDTGTVIAAKGFTFDSTLTVGAMSNAIKQEGQQYKVIQSTVNSLQQYVGTDITIN